MTKKVRATTLLNESGDTTIVWTEDQDDKWLEVIRKKMAEGVVFFVIEPRFFGLLPPKRVEIKDPKKALEHRAVSVRDQDIMRLVESGAGEAVPTPKASVRTVKKAETAGEAVENETVGVRPMKGG